MKKIVSKIKSGFWKIMQKIMEKQLRRANNIGYANGYDDGVGTAVLKLCEKVPSLPQYWVDHDDMFHSPIREEWEDQLDSSEEAFDELVAYIANLLGKGGKEHER